MIKGYVRGESPLTYPSFSPWRVCSCACTNNYVSLPLERKRTAENICHAAFPDCGQKIVAMTSDIFADEEVLLVPSISGDQQQIHSTRSAPAESIESTSRMIALVGGELPKLLILFQAVGTRAIVS